MNTRHQTTRSYCLIMKNYHIQNSPPQKSIHTFENIQLTITQNKCDRLKIITQLRRFINACYYLSVVCMKCFKLYFYILKSKGCFTVNMLYISMTPGIYSIIHLSGSDITLAAPVPLRFSSPHHKLVIIFCVIITYLCLCLIVLWLSEWAHVSYDAFIQLYFTMTGGRSSSYQSFRWSQ